jgi:hypothetical protein
LRTERPAVHMTLHQTYRGQGGRCCRRAGRIATHMVLRGRGLWRSHSFHSAGTAQSSCQRGSAAPEVLTGSCTRPHILLQQGLCSLRRQQRRAPGTCPAGMGPAGMCASVLQLFGEAGVLVHHTWSPNTRHEQQTSCSAHSRVTPSGSSASRHAAGMMPAQAGLDSFKHVFKLS